MDSLIYVVYGQGPHLDEVVYAILSARKALSRAKPDWQIVVYTDGAAVVRGLPAHLEVRKPAEFAAWMGPFFFNHRAKIFAIKDALNKFGDRVVYCDTDTYFIHSPELLFARIRPGVSFMHACEGPLDQANGADLAAFLNRAELRTVAGRRWNITDDAPMFNAGVVGMHKADVALLDDVAHLTDQIYPHVRIHTVEQFAFSMCLRERTRLCEAHEVVCHYWLMPGRARFQEELRRVLHDPSIASDEERWQRLTAHRPAQNITPLRRTMRERIRSTLKRGAKRVGVLEQVRFVMNKIRGSDAA